MKAFLLYNGIGDGEFIISVHGSLTAAKKAGDEFLTEPSNHHVRIEEWEFDNPTIINCWYKAHYVNCRSHSFDWRKT